jgi:hypothetical protein
MRKWLAAALCVLALGSRAAWAEPDSFGLGSGRDGPLSVTALGTVINSYAQVTASLAAGATTIQIGTCVGSATCFRAGDLVMVYQTTGLDPVPASGVQTPIDLGNNPVGRWEFARLASVTPSTLELTAPLVHAYATNVTQVIRVPEYTTVTIASGQSITAPPWSGTEGGIIAFLATGTVSNNGLITASGIGFRGGQFVNNAPGGTNCVGEDEPAPGGAQKGEGIGISSTQTGRGNVANGAGGGVCLKSGGGGGGNGGAGGLGGRSADSGREVGGKGGAALVYSTLNHFTFGGGGGAGHGSDGTGVAGGHGGGAIFIRATQLTGTGFITASGGSGGATASDGGSGGGSGGSIYLRFVRTAACASISATGGIGGNVNAIRVGPGGGGGGGQVLFQAAAGGTCGVIATGAASGIQQDPTDASYGAQAGSNSTPTVLPGGFIVPSPPTVVTPANNSITNNRRPPVTGKALPNATVIIYLDGNEVGRTTSDAAGNYSFNPPADLSDGKHTVQAVAEFQEVRSVRSTPNEFTVDTVEPDTTIVSGPPNFTQERNVTFEFNATEPVVAYECSLNGADFSPCPSPSPLTNLAEGVYTLQVRARDAAGNVDSTPASRTFRVTGADLALLGSGYGCSAMGRDSSLVLMGLGAFAALTRRRRRD